VSWPAVSIYEAVKEWATPVWLCDPCAATRRARKWTLRARRLPPPRTFLRRLDPGGSCDAALDDREPIACQDCHLRRTGVEPC
jgi:hypothetical protein